jgi:hypothetical protein
MNQSFWIMKHTCHDPASWQMSWNFGASEKLLNQPKALASSYCAFNLQRISASFTCFYQKFGYTTLFSTRNNSVCCHLVLSLMLSHLPVSDCLVSTSCPWKSFIFLMLTFSWINDKVQIYLESPSYSFIKLKEVFVLLCKITIQFDKYCHTVVIRQSLNCQLSLLDIYYS